MRKVLLLCFLIASCLFLTTHAWSKNISFGRQFDGDPTSADFWARTRVFTAQVIAVTEVDARGQRVIAFRVITPIWGDVPATGKGVFLFPYLNPPYEQLPAIQVNETYLLYQPLSNPDYDVVKGSISGEAIPAPPGLVSDLQEIAALQNSGSKMAALIQGTKSDRSLVAK